GPTGVGKTTTLAKIAANFVLKNKYDIGLITSDTYRIAAVEQLKTYSDILQLPLKIAYNKKEMIDAIDYFSSKDIILVDTAGRNHNDIEQLQQLKDILYTTKSKEIYLLVNANIGCRALKTLIEKYAFLEDYRIIITKVDEAESYGNILNIKYITNKQLSYFTIGQNVPDDIETINVENIAEKLIEENKND
ncbi:MAG TPA: flagellar biosynthesis protein FlhF, partial [Tissierella sp.]|nr:flagellar biosynthesis protein FlhF [Tissierella sp.]